MVKYYILISTISQYHSTKVKQTVEYRSLVSSPDISTQSGEKYDNIHIEVNNVTISQHPAKVNGRM